MPRKGEILNGTKKAALVDVLRKNPGISHDMANKILMQRHGFDVGQTLYYTTRARLRQEGHSKSGRAKKQHVIEQKFDIRASPEVESGVMFKDGGSDGRTADTLAINAYLNSMQAVNKVALEVGGYQIIERVVAGIEDCGGADNFTEALRRIRTIAQPDPDNSNNPGDK